jgi:hypothetical protein
VERVMGQAQLVVVKMASGRIVTGRGSALMKSRGGDIPGDG